MKGKTEKRKLSVSFLRAEVRSQICSLSSKHRVQDSEPQTGQEKHCAAVPTGSDKTEKMLWMPNHTPDLNSKLKKNPKQSKTIYEHNLNFTAASPQRKHHSTLVNT